VGWCYGSDELFLAAGIELPAEGYYDDQSLLENGVGAVRRFLTDFERGLPGVPRLRGRRIRVVTGTSMAPFLESRAPFLAERTGALVEVVPVRNRFYGETVTVAGLLAGADIRDALGPSHPEDLVLLPAESLNQDRQFIDSLPQEELVRALAPAQVASGHEITAVLRSL
jgi:NifB/MoaA-like Fe-S oxidoreductase